MVVEVSLNTPLADALSTVIQPKLVDIGWSTGGVDDSALSEYIILMLVNGKTQDQIATELSGDLLNLGPDDPGAIDFAAWLFRQVDALDKQINGGALQSVAKPSEAVDGGTTDTMPGVSDMDSTENNGVPGDQDTEMGDGANGESEIQIPTGPKSMRTGPRNRRLFGQVNKAMDRSNDAILHRVRNQQGTERINTHSREPPKGPRINTNRIQPFGNQRMINGRGMGGMQFGGMVNGGMANPGPGISPLMHMNMTPQQQMQLFSMYEEQARMMAQILSPQQQQQMFMGSPTVGPHMGPSSSGPGFPGQPPTPGRSLFERIQPRPQTGNNGTDMRRPSADKAVLNRKSAQPNATSESYAHPSAIVDPSSSMEVDASSSNGNADPATSVCKFNSTCTKEDCPYAHQSPAAPPGTTVDVHDECTFGAACKNRKCVARHPSPAMKSTHQAEQECKFFPNCTNPHCPFKHPTMPLCRNGADCTRSGCRFTHVKTACKFNPCLNPICPFKHAEGQRRGAFTDKVWTANDNATQEHVSERKFVEENGAEEELIIPASSAPSSQTEPAVTI
ncbi:MAG: hypothetical protein M1816_007209 [Peltula sp. TS41687]|nr:MAG: hypothetical protein M1816_007209 [Peltula sp. TS41687]